MQSIVIANYERSEKEDILRYQSRMSPVFTCRLRLLCKRALAKGSPRWCSMNKRNATKIIFATVLIVVPASIHAIFGVIHASNAVGLARKFWIQYPLSMTIPYIFLGLLFLAHCDFLKTKSRTSAYSGAIGAWLGMMTYSSSLVFRSYSEIGPTGATLAVVLTPFFYLPFLILPYAVGTAVGILWNKWTTWKGNGT